MVRTDDLAPDRANAEALGVAGAADHSGCPGRREIAQTTPGRVLDGFPPGVFELELHSRDPASLGCEAASHGAERGLHPTVLVHRRLRVVFAHRIAALFLVVRPRQSAFDDDARGTDSARHIAV